MRDTNKKNTIENYKNKITIFLQKNGKKPVQAKELAAKCRSQRGDSSNYNAALADLISDGIVFGRKRGYVLASSLGYFTATITRLSKTFGFASKTDDETEVFIPGKFMMGAMPDDFVLMRLIPSRSGSPEGEVVDVLKQNTSQFTGMITQYDDEYYILPDTMTKNHIKIDHENDVEFKNGDKVLAAITFRGTRHADHKAKVIFNFGCAENAVSCALSVLAVNGIEIEFPEEVMNEAKKLSDDGIKTYDYNNRLDLREECIFTIDSAESKDLDDAVSVTKTSKGYDLGVHIADVSNYVKGNSPLDKEALKRGTSVYYANKVVPMLPKELSNGICSLNPKEDRLTFSALMKISPDGELLSYEFKKSVICSRVKGVYAEINQILEGKESPEIAEKYADTRETIFVMEELAEILYANKKKRGAPEIETSESKLIIDENDMCVDVKLRERGKSEAIIEEFMLMANEAAAKLAKSKMSPFVYRIHESPSPEKIATLKEYLAKFNIECPQFTEVKPEHLAQILRKSKDLPSYSVINKLVLRSMAKAKYSPQPVGHFGLALDDYSHFTSPIRRYPDLAIHRILTDIIGGYDDKWLEKRYSGFVTNASERSSHAELNAMKVERDCEDCYKAEYMKQHLGEEYDAVISSVIEFGFYVELANSVEGLVHVHTLSETGVYNFDGVMTLTEEHSGKQYTVGDKVKVICTKADVNSGLIDFKCVEEE